MDDPFRLTGLGMGGTVSHYPACDERGSAFLENAAIFVLEAG
jgi:hypothetical protein